MLRRYLWVVHFLVLPAGAYLVADMINLVIGSRLEASIKPLEEAPPPVGFRPTSRVSFSEIIEGNIFNAKLRGTGEEEPASPAPMAVEPVPLVDLQLILTGTVVGEGTASFAIIEHRARREQVLYRLGETIERVAKIIEVDRDGVTLLIGGARKRLDLYLEEEPGGPVLGFQPGGDSGGFARVTPNRWVLDREEITAALDDLPRLLTKARVVPNFSGGKPDGFRVFSIIPNSFFSKIGLQNGDVLQRINGIEIQDPENFMRIFQQLKGESSVTLDLVRHNQKQTFSYEVR